MKRKLDVSENLALSDCDQLFDSLTGDSEKSNTEKPHKIRREEEKGEENLETKEEAMEKRIEHEENQSIVILEGKDAQQALLSAEKSGGAVAIINISEMLDYDNIDLMSDDIIKEQLLALLEDVNGKNSFDVIQQQLKQNNNNYVTTCTKVDSIIKEATCEERFDPFEAIIKFQEKCNPAIVEDAERRVSVQPLDVLCHTDKDGDTPLMIIVSKTMHENRRLFENLFALQERLQHIRFCCNEPLADEEACCSRCGKNDPDSFHTPLSMKNNMNDSALTCAIKMGHPKSVIDYLLAGLVQCKEDILRIFDESGSNFCRSYCQFYSSLSEFV